MSTSSSATPYRTFRDHLSEPLWQELLRIGKPVRYSRGEPVLHEGEQGEHVLAVTAGVCKVVAARPDSGKALIAVRGAGDTLGEFAVLDQHPRSASVIAVNECRAHLLPATDFTGFLRRHRLEGVLSQYLSAKLRYSSNMVSELAGLPVRSKVAWLLCCLAGAGDADAFIPLFQHDIAELLGAARSSVAMSLASFREAGMLRTEPGGVHLLDPAALAAEIHRPRSDD